MNTYFILTLLDRKKIAEGLVRGDMHKIIADRIGCHPSTISREIKRLPQGRYDPAKAHRQATKRVSGRRKMKCKLILNEPLRHYVHDKLQQKWSPEQIAEKLKQAYTNPAMQISHEAIYQYIYVLPRGKLKQTLIKGLRQERKYRRVKRKKSPNTETRGKIQGMLSIHERPSEVADRTVPGHWEGDLIIGKYRASALATLVERTTRYTMIIPLRNGKKATDVREALQDRLQTLPSHLCKTLTYDQGKEMSQHKQFTIDTGITVYFADPGSPWQRGTNENTNGLIRQFFPKGTDFRIITDQEIQYAEDLLNGRPRKCLNFAFPKEKFYDLVALDC